VLTECGYGYDEASRRRWRQDLTAASDQVFDRFFGYDALGQVTAADRGTLNDNRTAIGGIPEEAESWRYDEQGNWLDYDKAEDGSSVIDQTRTHHRSNQIVSIDGSSAGVAYDNNGNMTRVPTGEGLTGAPRKLTWDALSRGDWREPRQIARNERPGGRLRREAAESSNQLIEVRDDSDNLIERNAYDALSRRTTRELGSGTVLHTYYSDQWRPVEERKDSSANPSRVWYWGARHRDDLARRDRDTTGDGSLDESLWCLMDYFDPVAIIDDTATVQERYGYTAFGVSSVLAPDYSARSSSSFDWEFRFHGQFEDEETGWQNYGYRFYVPAVGRWINRDPAEEGDGVNLYLFVRNGPGMATDHFGLWTCDPCSEQCNKCFPNPGDRADCEADCRNAKLSMSCGPDGGGGETPFENPKNWNNWEAEHFEAFMETVAAAIADAAAEANKGVGAASGFDWVETIVQGELLKKKLFWRRLCLHCQQHIPFTDSKKYEKTCNYSGP